MIRSSAQSASYAVSKGLRPFSQWVRLTNADTFIVGPFDFAVINGHKSKDRVPFTQWKILSTFKHLLNNDTRGHFHTSFVSAPTNARIVAHLANPTSLNTV